ncbi:hypothetical protein M409DRAFT_29418 [Zasmidium cellare ATCC 36951]|uniref:Uncharacterized protein n=1 Tax=Zasmidium cellare ATCC 36951 TaxID=1080233 RepID=A0A6A6BZB0_ZASCE|nr:uncharacterized protein M409DRAFT_29418 [Zasmidium cellare ATCC 36951]KAF2160121.1 hypothetical protein M409DRAFT_29418 [Zasmidium cellare ATCC 36951]
MPPNSKFDGSEAIPPNATFDQRNLAGKTVIITGGASGIGEAVVRGFVQAGAVVTCGDVDEVRGKALARELGGDERVVFVKCDVLRWEDQLWLFKRALERGRGVDVVVANAGLDGEDTILKQKPVTANGDPTEPDLKILKTNLIGVAYTARLANFYFSKQAKPSNKSLIITASLSSYIDHPFSPEYSASKWGVRGMMRSLRSTAGVTGMRVNLVAPWYIKTRIFSDEMVRVFEASGEEWALGEDAAGAVMHFAADSRINGINPILPIDGD